MLELSAEDSILFLTCQTYLRAEDDQALERLVSTNLHWAFILWRAENNRTLPILKYHLDRLGLLDRLPIESRAYLARWTVLSKLRSLVQFRNLGQIIDTFDSAGIANFLVKGPDLALLAHPDPLIRPMTDVDIMIHPRDAWRVQRVMFELGYRHGIFDPATGTWTDQDYVITDESLRDNYALPIFVRLEELRAPFPAEAIPPPLRHKHIKAYVSPDGQMRMPVFVDLHVNLSAGMDENDIWAGVRLAEVLKRVVRVQSASGAVWFLAARLYHEAFLYNSLRLVMLGDLHAVLHKRQGEIDWPEVVRIAFKYEMRPALFYVLAQMRALCSDPVPTEVLALLRPDPTEIPLQHDWGDLLPKLFSVPHVNGLRLAAGRSGS